MYKQYKFIKTCTAGNTTGFIIGKDAFRNKESIMKSILNKVNLEAEQYAFLWEEDGEVVMNMAGGEISGGAILASPILLGISNYTTRINVVGENLCARVKLKEKNKINTQTQLPSYIIQSAPKKLNSQTLKVDGYVVNLRDIAYFVTKENITNNKTLSLFKKLDAEILTQDIPCIGIIEVKEEGVMKPTVWVKEIGTITEEQGCTTGTISAQLAFPKKNGLWQQPSGSYIKAVVKNDFVEIEADVELLSSGSIYLNDK